MQTMQPVLPEPTTALEDWIRTMNRMETRLRLRLSGRRKIEVKYEQ